MASSTTTTTARIGTVLLAAVAVVSLSFVRCYNATELVLDLRTNLPCETFQPRTQIRMGDASQTVADTASCESSSSSSLDQDRTIGTLTFVPSGDREATVVVEVALAVKGARPEDCATHPDKCIVAKRAFSFIEHSSRRLPIILRGQCLGKVCPHGETCVEGGLCVAIEAACLIEACEPDRTPPAPTSTTPTTTPDSGKIGGCSNGDIRCVGSRLEECKNGKFELLDLCDTPALCEQRSGNKCGTIGSTGCTKNERKCVGGNVVQCRSDNSGFDIVAVCNGGMCVEGPPHCVITTSCTPGNRTCDTGCEISGKDKGSSADDCLVRCNASGVFVFEQNCGIAQHGTCSDSCRPAPMNNGAECFSDCP